MAKGRKQIGRLNILPEGQIEDNDPVKVMGIDSNGDVVYADPGSVSDITRTSQLINDGEDGIPYQVIVTDITELESFAGEAICILVEDSLRGGVFKYVASGFTVDNGTIFNATGKGSGYWERIYNLSEGLNVLWYGADPSGLVDSSDIIESVIVDYSYKTGIVFIPEGNYKIINTIGDVGTGSTRHIVNNVIVRGTPETNLVIDNVNQISSVIGFDIRGVNLMFENLNIIGSNKANRGIYIRQQLQDAPLVERSNIIVRNCNISNVYGTTGNIESSIVGIAIYGYFENVFVYENNIINVTTDSLTLPVKGMFTAGSSVNGVPINSKVFRNSISNVSRTDNTSLLDQDGIHISGLSVNNSLYKSEVWGNTISDCRGRMIKTQTLNNSIYDNLLIVNESYQMPSNHDGSAINIQYSDANVFNNTLIHRNTDNNNFNAMVGFIERTTDQHEHRINIYGNRVFASGIKYFMSIWEDNQAMLGVLNCYDNVVDATVDSFIWFLGYNTTLTQRNVNLKANVVKSVTNTFINSNINQITFNLDYNVNRGTVIAASNATNSLFLTNNVGFTNPNSYELRETGTGYQYYNAGVKTLVTGASTNIIRADGTIRNKDAFVYLDAILNGSLGYLPVNSPVAISDNTVTIIGKLQGQINSITSNKVTKGGDSDGANLVIGTNDGNNVIIRRNGGQRVVFNAIGTEFNTSLSGGSWTEGSLTFAGISTPTIITSARTDAQPVLSVQNTVTGGTGDLVQFKKNISSTLTTVCGVRPDGRAYGSDATAANDFITKGQYDLAKAIVDSALTTTQTAATLNTKYPSVPFPYVVFAPNVGSSMTYVKVNATQWMSYSGVLLS